MSGKKRSSTDKSPRVGKEPTRAVILTLDEARAVLGVIEFRLAAGIPKMVAELDRACAKLRATVGIMEARQEPEFSRPPLGHGRLDWEDKHGGRR